MKVVNAHSYVKIDYTTEKYLRIAPNNKEKIKIYISYLLVYVK